MKARFFQLPPVAFVRGVADTYGHLGVARAAASLAYFLILTLFPLLMCVNYFIGLLELDPEAVFSALDSILPRESLSAILDYLTYVSGIPQGQSTPLFLASLFTILLSASAGLRTLLKTMDELYGVRHTSSLRRLAVSLVLSLLFLLTIYLSIVVIFTGDWFFHFLEAHLPAPVLELVPLALLSGIWGRLRYLVLFFFVLLLVLSVYHLGTPSPLRREKKSALFFRFMLGMHRPACINLSPNSILTAITTFTWWRLVIRKPAAWIKSSKKPWLKKVLPLMPLFLSICPTTIFWRRF